MNNSDKICVDDIGPVLFERSRRARRIIISVRASKGVKVSVPTRNSFKQALEFVHLKKRWIKKHLVLIEQTESLKSALKETLLPIDEPGAKRKLTDRLHQLADEHGFKYHNAAIRKQRTRWGSCSCNNNISLNLKLVRLPDELMDYVILHELVHTRIHNHSEKFWTELDRYVGNGKDMAKRLRKSDLSIL